MIAHATITTITTVSGPAAKQNKKKKDKIEMIVVDEELIKESVREYNNENKILIKGDIILSSLCVLSLSFKNIWRVQNLQGLDRLEKLQLDNNCIEKIESLDHLVSLKWLDLSFNNIKEIQGLEKLKNLQDITLFSNFITKVEGLDGCPLLNVFSIGNNKLENYESIINVFRGTKFKNLQVLNVAGNPFTNKESDYKQHLIFNLINLKYLDYVFIDEVTRSEINQEEKFRNQIANQENLLKTLAHEEEEEKSTREENKKKEDSKMHLIDKLHDELAQEPDLDRIRTLRGVEEEINKFQERIKEAVEQLQKTIIQKNSVKIQDVDKFLEAIRFRERESENETVGILREFEHEKKIAFRMHESQKPEWREKMQALHKKAMNTKDKLINIEVILIDELEESIKDFKSKTLKITTDMEKFINNCFVKIKDDYIKEFSKKIQDISLIEFDRFNQVSGQQQGNPNAEELQNDWTEDQQNLLDNREALMSTLGNIKENIQQKADKKEGEITKAISDDVANFSKDVEEKQYERNRRNISNIYTKIEEYKSEIEAKLAGEDSESDRD